MVGAISSAAESAPAVPAQPCSGIPPCLPSLSPWQPRPAAITDESIKEKVLEIVAEKTGYPKDMLDLDLDLEADLGVDTVKQAEMIAAVRETLQHSARSEHKAARFPTLSHVIGFVQTSGLTWLGDSLPRQRHPCLLSAASSTGSAPVPPAVIAASPGASDHG